MSNFDALLNSLNVPQLQGLSTPGPQAPPGQVSQSRPLQTTQATQPAQSGVKRKHDVLSETPPVRPPPSAISNGVPLPTQTLRPDRPRPAGVTNPSYHAANGSARLTAASPLTTSKPAESKPPSKNSYQAILARAQEAQAKQASIGQIKHKTAQKPIKHAGPRTPELAVKPKPGTAGTQSQVTKSPVKGQTGKGNVASTVVPVKPKRKPLDLGYSGTMRPSGAIPGRESTSRSPANAASRPKPQVTGSHTRLAERPRPPQKKPTGIPSERDEKRYHYAESDDEGEEDCEGDDSGEDMDGGGFDELMEEEEASARAAKKEDAKELRYETEAKKLKAQKKAAFEKLQAARKARGGG